MTKQTKKWRWTLKASVVCGVTAALTFAASFVFGAAITAAMGPGMSGFFTIVITTMIVMLGAKIADRFGAFFMIGMLFSILTIPTTLFGPPGIEKLAIGFVLGVLFELSVWLFRRRDVGYLVAGSIGSIGAIFAIWGLMLILEKEIASQLSAVIAWIWIPYGLLGLLGSWLGLRIFKSIKHLRPIQGLMEKENR
jgi:hypothetical protein